MFVLPWSLWVNAILANSEYISIVKDDINYKMSNSSSIYINMLFWKY